MIGAAVERLGAGPATGLTSLAGVSALSAQNLLAVSADHLERSK